MILVKLDELSDLSEQYVSLRSEVLDIITE